MAVISPKTSGEGAFFIRFRNGGTIALFRRFNTRAI
jgi:hypothetical protein